MSDRPGERPVFNGHNADTISVRDYFEARLRDMNERWKQRADALEESGRVAVANAEKAVNKAEEAQALRNNVANEFRGTLADQNATMWPSKEGMAAVKALEDKMDGIIVALRRELDARLQPLEQTMARRTGLGQGSERVVAYLLALVGLGIAVTTWISR